MSKVTELASASINGHDTITVELIETDQTPGGDRQMADQAQRVPSPASRCR